RIDLDLELLDGVDHRVEGDLSRLGLERRNAVVEVFIDARPAAVDARKRRAGCGRRRRGDAWHKCDQGEEIASVQSQINDASDRGGLPATSGLAPQPPSGAPAPYLLPHPPH